MELRQVSTTTHPIAFLMVDSSTKVGKTGLSPTVTLSKNGEAFGAAVGTVTELAVGWYQLAGNATDRDTLGSLIVHATASGADASDTLAGIVNYDPYATSTAYTGYGDADDVAALAKIWTRGGVWYDTVPAYGSVAEVKGTNPTLAQVEVWLTDVSAIVDVALAGVGFDVPVTALHPEALQATDSFVNSVVADLCHAANSSGRLYSQKIIEKGLSPMVLVNQQAGNWAEEWTAGFRRLGVSWTQAPVPPAFSVEAGKQL